MIIRINIINFLKTVLDLTPQTSETLNFTTQENQKYRSLTFTPLQRNSNNNSESPHNHELHYFLVNQDVENSEETSQAASFDNTSRDDQLHSYCFYFDNRIVETTKVIDDTQPNTNVCFFKCPNKKSFQKFNPNFLDIRFFFGHRCKQL